MIIYRTPVQKYLTSLIEEEFRSQNSGAEPETLRQGVRINQSGIKTRDCLFNHQIFLFCEGAKTPIIHPLFRSEYLSCILTSDS
jgi:hypothetical protein